MAKLMNPFRKLPRRSRRSSRYFTPDLTRIYAIGDIHGCRSSLEDLLEMIERDLAGWSGATELVFLGDYVDRGPDSAGVIAQLLGKLPGDRQVFLRGNHEEAMSKCLKGEGAIAQWLTYGGIQTLESYGLDRGDLFQPGFDLKRWAERHFPERHWQFLEALVDYHEAAGYLFVHAGLRPGVPLDEQADADLRWIRGEFLEDESDHGFMVVHGHTISREVSEQVNRLGIDTGCYHTGKLTAAVLERSSRRFLQTSPRQQACGASE